jgi:hypothetical protein
VEDEATHGDGAQGEPEEALLRADPHQNQTKRTESINRPTNRTGRTRNGIGRRESRTNLQSLGSG